MWGMAHPSMNGFSDIKPLHCKTYVFYIYIYNSSMNNISLYKSIYIYIYIIYTEVSKHGGTPNHPFIDGFSI